MSTYTKATDFLAKDSLPLNNAAKYVKGSEIDTEFDAIETADADNMKKSAMGTSVETFLGTPSSANLAAAVTGETGTGALVFATSPTLVTPVLGVAAATSIAINGATAISSQTGTGGVAVMATSPTLVTPILGVATATSINKTAITAPASGSTIAIADGKTFTVNNTMTLTGTDATSYSLDNIGLLPKNYLTGATLSTAGASATMTIAEGQGTDSANVANITLAASISKTTSAWALGTAAGGLDTGAIANATWYHFYLIRRPDTGVVDVTFSTNAATPTLPANYTQYRRIGSGLTNGSAQWVKFSQRGDEFLWDAAVVDIDATNPGTAAVSRTLSTPLGVQTVALITGGLFTGTSNTQVTFSSLDVSDQTNQSQATAALTTFPSVSGFGGAPVSWNLSNLQIRTNTSSQIRSRLFASGAADRVGIITRGWIDSRGKN